MASGTIRVLRVGDLSEIEIPKAVIYMDAPYADMLEYGTQPSTKSRSAHIAKSVGPKNLSTTSTKMDQEKWRNVPEYIRNIAEWLRTKSYSQYQSSDDYVSARGKGGRKKSEKAGLDAGILMSEKELYQRAWKIYSKMMTEGMPPHPFFRRCVNETLADLDMIDYPSPKNVADTIKERIEQFLSTPDESLSLWGTGNLAQSVKVEELMDISEFTRRSKDVPRELWMEGHEDEGVGKWAGSHFDRDGKSK